METYMFCFATLTGFDKDVCHACVYEMEKAGMDVPEEIQKEKQTWKKEGLSHVHCRKKKRS